MATSFDGLLGPRKLDNRRAIVLLTVVSVIRKKERQYKRITPSSRARLERVVAACENVGHLHYFAPDKLFLS